MSCVILFASPVLDRLAAQLSLKQRIVSTASVLFRRFVLRHPLADADPRVMCIVCLLVASKAEDSPIFIKDLIRAVQSEEPSFKCTPESLIAGEWRVMAAFDGDVVVCHPHHMLCEYLADVSQNPCLDTAWRLLNDMYRTWVMLLHPPHVIAVTCAYMAFTLHGLNPDEWITKIQVPMTEVGAISKRLLAYYATCDSLPLTESNGCTEISLLAAKPSTVQLLSALSACHDHVLLPAAASRTTQVSDSTPLGSDSVAWALHTACPAVDA